MKITAIELSDEDIVNIVIAAAEGGMNYWGEVDSYPWRSWHTDPSDINSPVIKLEKDFVFFRVTDTNEDDFQDLPVTPETVRKGAVYVLNHYPHQIRVLGDDDLDVDATGAEMILQAGLFGEIVYG